MRNASGIRPLGWAVLCEPFETAIKAERIAIPDAVAVSTAVLDQRVRVVEVGSEAWKNESHVRAKPGDVVLVSKLAGHIATGEDGKLYRLVNANDIFARIGDRNAG